MKPEKDQYSLLTPQAGTDPYSVYRRLRNEAPVYWSPELQGWLITRYQDIWTSLQDQRLSLGGGVDQMFINFPEDVRHKLAPLRKHLSLWMGTLDPPEHTRVRGVLSKGFTPALVESMRPFIRETADELLQKARDIGENIDLVRELAHPLPAIVIAAMLGTPAPDRHLFKQWSETLTEFLGFGHFEVEIMFKAQTTIAEMTDYLRHLLHNDEGDKRARNLLDLYRTAVLEGELQSEEELLANLVLLLFAGHETTSILIANSLLLLLSNPQQLDHLINDNSLIIPALEEFLRFESPVQMVRRSAREDIRLEDNLIHKRDMVWLVLGSANRDPEMFPNPDSLDINRQGNRHLSFGAGIHYCLGAALSRVEAEEVIKLILEDLPAMSLHSEQVERVFNPTARALKTLPVSWKKQKNYGS